MVKNTKIFKNENILNNNKIGYKLNSLKHTLQNKKVR